MKKRAMESSTASYKKKLGHYREDYFVSIIDGIRLNDIGKTDVMDNLGFTYSVKGGGWWQLFLYTEKRISEDSLFISMSGIQKALLDCLGVFPQEYGEYLENKNFIKTRLQEPMMNLNKELSGDDNLYKFLKASIFNGDEVDFLVVMPKTEEKFLIFEREELLDILVKSLNIGNSKARTIGQMDNQKVLFRTNINIGELEIRTDSKIHYRRAKFRLSSPKILMILENNITNSLVINNSLTAYGESIGIIDYIL